MPFEKINTKEIINNKLNADKEFKENYDEIKTEYELIKKVVKARKEMGLTQKNLADKIGVKQQVISRFERERNIPNLNSFVKILNGLDLKILISEKK